MGYNSLSFFIIVPIIGGSQHCQTVADARSYSLETCWSMGTARVQVKYLLVWFDMNLEDQLLRLVPMKFQIKEGEIVINVGRNFTVGHYI